MLAIHSYSYAYASMFNTLCQCDTTECMYKTKTIGFGCVEHYGMAICCFEMENIFGGLIGQLTCLTVENSCRQYHTLTYSGCQLMALVQQVLNKSSFHIF